MKTLAMEGMSKDLVTIGWNETIQTAYRRMSRHHFRHLPVHNESGEIIGMLSDRDVQRAMRSTIRHESTWGDETVEFDPESKVRDYMSWPPVAMEGDTELKDLATRMIQEKLSSILVLQNGVVKGLITTDDMLKMLIELLETPHPQARLTLLSALETTFKQAMRPAFGRTSTAEF